MFRGSYQALAAVVLGLSTAWLLFVSAPMPAAEADDAPAVKKDAAIERTRRQVKMLDDLYKTTIVFITNTYVDDDGDVAAGEIARDLFGAMREKGWHDARLVDATGHPTNDENAPRDGFEKAAIKKILAGETYVDKVTTEKGKSYLLAATVVPVVNQKCVLCHPTWKVGEVIGAVSYKLPIE
ncbi:MAG: c-type heme family protein [Pirellulales bacterium]